MYMTGRDLRRMRLNAHRTTSDMARIAGVKTRKTYENWEKNVGTPSINQFVAMCDGCNIDSAKFVGLMLQRPSLQDEVNLSQASK
ncbi:XRE family transcriptional regulator [Alteromonadaceae bacterium M269]|nr:XRE family transcriptional regulator [Alteromonadaceae bacterium M269]